MIAGFQTNYPEIRVDQSYGYFTTLCEDLLADRIDLAICPIDLLEEDSPLTFTEVLPGRNVIACANTHPLLGRKPASAESLQAYPWVAPPPAARFIQICAKRFMHRVPRTSRFVTAARLWEPY